MGFSTAIIFLATVACVPSQDRSADYVVDQATGHSYRLMYVAQPWDRAVEECAKEGSKLAVPKSREEFLFLQKLVRSMHYPSIVGAEYKLLVWLGVYNLGDYRVWRNIHGEKIEDTGFHEWAPNNGVGWSNNPAEPHCAGMDAVNPGLREYWCKNSQPFICQKLAF